MLWAHNNLLKLNEYTTLFCRYNIFADLQTIYTFHFEVKLYKYVVLRTERVLRSILKERCGIRLWKVVKRNNRSGSYIFNGCSVQIPLLPSKKVPFFKRASWASSLI